jgi:anti-sigma factor RsiW
MMQRLTCKQAHRLIVASMDSELELNDSARVRLHLRACPCCANFVQQMQAMRRILKALPERLASAR